MKVLIVGSGPTGLTAALELARKGVEVRVVEKRTTPSGFSRAVGILPNSLELLQASGVAEQLLSEGVKMQQVRVYENDSPILSLSLAGCGVEPECIVALAQDRTESILRNALLEHSIEVEFGVEVTGVSQDNARVSAQFVNDEESHFDYLLAADGISSTVRQDLGIDYHGFDLPETWSIADVNATGWVEPERFTMCLLDEGEIVVVSPLEKDRYRVISNTPDALVSLPLTMNVENIRRAGEFNIAIRQAERYQQGRVFLAGDAAHCHSPAGGRGMNLGIADAAEFANRLINDNSEGYSESRHQAGQQTIQISERIRKLVTTQSGFAKMGIVGAMKVVDRMPLVKRKIAKQFIS